jgi:hypothetical protein
MGRYSRPLKVSTPEGKRIIANILQMGESNRIEIAFIEGVQKDNPPFAQNGVIRFVYEKEKHQEVISALEKYLEDIFLKGMADEDTYTSLGAKPKPRGVKSPSSERKIRGTERERKPDRIYSRPRRGKQTESDRGGDADSEMAESGDQGSGEQDKNGD